MTVRYGFFNSLDGDRKYDASDFSRLFEGIIADGVFPNVGLSLEVTQDLPTASMAVRVGSGRAYFEGHWIWNDDILPLTIEEAHPTLSRIDGIILEVDERDAVRACSIKVKKGTPAVNPDPIGLYEDAERLEVLLAEVTVGPGATAITASKIHSYIGTNYCPYVVGAVQNINLDVKFTQWEAIFTEWFETLQTNLEGDVAANLAAEIDALELQVSNLEEATTITSGTAAPTGGVSGDVYLRYI